MSAIEEFAARPCVDPGDAAALVGVYPAEGDDVPWEEDVLWPEIPSELALGG